MKNILSIFFFFIFLSIQLSAKVDSIKTIINLDTSYYENKIFCVSTIGNCISCDMNKMKMMFNEISKNYNNNVKINLIIEVENSGDANYLKRKFKNINIIEDNRLFITKKYNCNYLFILSKKDKYLLLKLDKFNDLRDYKAVNYLYNQSNNYRSNFKIFEEDDYLLSDIKVFNINDTLKIFDYNNHCFNTYDKFGKLQKKDFFIDTLLIYKSDIKYINKLVENGMSFDFDISKVLISNDTLFLLYNRLIREINIDKNEKYALNMRSAIVKSFDNKTTVEHIFDIGEFMNFWKIDSDFVVTQRLHPKLMNENTYIIFNLDTNNQHSIFTKSINNINNTFDLKLKSIFDIAFIEIINSNLILSIQNQNYLYIQNMNDKFKLKLKGISSFNPDIRIYDIYINKNNIYLILKDQINSYIQLYNISDNSLIWELISYNNEDELIDSYFYQINDNQIKFINRWKKDRWKKETLIIK